MFAVRPMQISDIEYGIALSNAEGWNQTEDDWKFLIEHPGNICLLAEADNKVIGTTTAINYSNELAWIGMVLVDKHYRRMGVSTSLLTNILKELESCKSIKLDATSAGQQVYKNFGFEDEYFINRMTCSSMKRLLKYDEADILPKQIQSKDINEIAAFDQRIFGANRIQLIQYLVKEYSHKAWLLKRNNEIAGFALGRDGYKYHYVGPVIASTTNDAKLLIWQSLKELNNQPIVIDVLDDKKELIGWFTSIGYIKQRHFVRMYKKENVVSAELDKMHLICGPEFG